jgi:hypothetical protein
MTLRVDAEFVSGRPKVVNALRENVVTPFAVSLFRSSLMADGR